MIEPTETEPAATGRPRGIPPFRVCAVRRRIVVVGLGSIGRRHARLLASRPDVAVEYCDPDWDAVARGRQESGAHPVHGDFEAALRSRPSAVVIATPHALHAPQAIAAMRAGADVLCEKPLCVDPTEAARVIDCAEATGRRLAVGFQNHFHPGLVRLRELIHSGAIGTVAHLHVRVGSFVTLRNSHSRYQEALRGALLLDYAHQPDLIFWLLGTLPAGVTLTGLRAGTMPLSSDPNVMVLALDYNRPLLATVHLNYLQMPQRHEWEIVGDRGWALLDVDRGTLRIGSREKEAESDEAVPIERDAPYRAEHQAFLDFLDGRRGPESSAVEAAFSVQLFAAAMQSLDAGRRVPCEWPAHVVTG